MSKSKLSQTTIIVGAQWGDEGKGKITDFFAGECDYVVRFQGGNNAGHTVIVGDEVYKLSRVNLRLYPPPYPNTYHLHYVNLICNVRIDVGLDILDHNPLSLGLYLFLLH